MTAATGPPRTCAVSVDVDDLRLYCGIHGLDPGLAGPQAWTCGVRRFLDLFDRHRLPATFFVVGEDLASPGPARDLAQEARRRGHEVANHSWSHPYDLVRLDPDARRREIEEGAAAIEAAVGASPRGFRAPGYTVDRELLRLVARTGHAYDSSLFPCPPYYLAKWATLAGMRLARRRSRSVPGDPRALLAPTRPYRPGRSAYRPAPPGTWDLGLLEVPIAVTPVVRFPIIGTTLLLLGPRWLDALLPALALRRPLLNLELHAIDLVGLREDDLDPALSIQPDLGLLGLRHKAETLAASLDRIALAYQFETLETAARRWDEAMAQ